LRRRAHPDDLVQRLRAAGVAVLTP